MSRRITPRSQPDRALANVIRRRRDQRDVSAEMRAHDAGITVSAYLRIEGGASAPGWSTVRRIAEAFKVSLKDLGEMVGAEG